MAGDDNFHIKTQPLPSAWQYREKKEAGKGQSAVWYFGNAAEWNGEILWWQNLISCNRRENKSWHLFLGRSLPQRAAEYLAGRGRPERAFQSTDILIK